VKKFIEAEMPGAFTKKGKPARRTGGKAAAKPASTAGKKAPAKKKAAVKKKAAKKK